MTKLAPEWVRTSDPVIRSPARYRWTTAPAIRILEDILQNIAYDRTYIVCSWFTELYRQNEHIIILLCQSFNWEILAYQCDADTTNMTSIDTSRVEI